MKNINEKNYPNIKDAIAFNIAFDPWITGYPDRMGKSYYEILCDEWSFNTPIRMLTVSVSGLVDSASSFTQLDLFSTVDADARDREKRREETVDAIRKKFGVTSISNGAFFDTDIGVGVKKS